MEESDERRAITDAAAHRLGAVSRMAVSPQADALAIVVSETRTASVRHEGRDETGTAEMRGGRAFVHDLRVPNQRLHPPSRRRMP